MENECRFEPDSVEIRCALCGTKTGERGTCADQFTGLCSECRQGMRESGKTERQIAELAVKLAEGDERQKVYARPRQLHYATDSTVTGVACNAKGGPHPSTTNINEVTCKRCLLKGAQR